MSLPIGHQQTISQPFVVAKMTEILIQGNVLEERPLGAVLKSVPVAVTKPQF